MTPNIKGALLMTGSMGAFTLNDVCVKLAAEGLPLFQIIFLRGCLTTTLLVLIALSFGQLHFRVARADRIRIAIRTLFEIVGMVLFLTALLNMPIANATAILSALPLIITVAATVFLSEPLGWRRLSAIVVGLLGVVLIVQPGTEGFNIYALSVLAAVLCFAGRDLVTRRLGADVSSMSVSVVTAAAVGLFGGAMTLGGAWVEPTARDITFVVLSALFIIGGYLCSVMVMRVGEVGATAPFRYTSLVFALFLGLIVFGEWPNALAMAGAAIVVVTGIYTILRERALARRVRPTAAPVSVDVQPEIERL